ncbi:MAG: PSD1 and planctomycete cytochrome C domain-containing protein [Acidobacteria bacterium]|nr:PSD1 and planctomycete cytochrome C domain-containing protein [Acidobacteriota bacterium]
MMRSTSIFAAILVLLAWTSASAAVEFERDIQPLLQRSCHGCHGEAQQMGQLRLDSKAAAFRGGVSKNTLVPGKPDQSELYLRVAGTSSQVRMPMGGELAAEEIALIRGWIEQGADWPDTLAGTGSEVNKHWGFVRPQKAPLPHVRQKDWPANPIDYFVLARLETEGLQPAPEADEVKLLRRLSLDLIGLPPTIEETDAFVAGRGPDAYRKQVERLLNSPHYGERWGRHWLDAARYADSDGFEKDKPRRVWFYRDWVVNALNDDMPYDRFVIEQLAGDLLPNATQSQKVATGFLRNSMINEEGGINPEQFRMEAMFDRMDAVGTAVLGLTVKCAQCHNHKYDPLTQEEYYRMFAFLNNAHEANIAVYTPEQQEERSKIFGEIRAIEDGLQRRNPGWADRVTAWEESVRGDQREWTLLEPKHEEPSGQKYHYYKDGSILAQGYAPTRHDLKMEAKTGLRKISAFRLELLNDPALPLGGPGRSLRGTSALTEFEVEVAPASDPEERKKLKFEQATADVNPPLRELDLFLFPDKENKRRITGEVDFAIDGFEMSAWSTDNGPARRNQPRKAVFRLSKPIDVDEDVVLTFHLVQKHGGWNSDDNQNNNLGRFRLSATTAENAVADPLPADVRSVLSVASGNRTQDQQRAVFSYWRTTVPEWSDANARIGKLLESHPEGSAQLILSERDQPRTTQLLARGDFLQPKDTVEPGTPAFLHPMPASDEPARLRFARWAVDAESPTAARTIVNRIWQSYFGVGLVSTSENLGTQSEAPSHPKLLDWLAVELMENNWSRKHLHRLIVTSKAYRQSSRSGPELLTRDPDNRLLARGPRLRVEAEIVRDIALSASGLLDTRLGGPPVYPPAPEFLFLPPVSYGPKRWYTESGQGGYRRSLYTFRYRSLPYPILDAFDAPNGDAACVRRTRSNTPLQALATLNEPVYMEAARALARRTLAEGGAADRERINYAFRLCLTREPEPAESDELLAMLERQRERIASGELDARRLGGEGAVNAAELAAWTTVSRVLLNLDETITKE